MNIIEFIEDDRFIGDKSLSLPQKVTLKSLYGLDLDHRERKVFYKITGLNRYKKKEYKNATFVISRRGGKSDKISSNVGIFEAVMRNHRAHLSTGERAYILVIASSMRQARTLFGYIEGKMKNSKILSRMIESVTKEEIALNNKCTIGIYPCTQKHRGLSVACAVLDECAFFRHEGVMVDKDIVNSIKPALITFPHSKLLLVSSPYGKRGIVFENHRDHYGKDTDILIVQGSSDYFNPKISKEFVRQESQKDHAFARSEYMGQFRDDLEDFISVEALDKTIARGRLELAYNEKMKLYAWVDPSGGVRDDMTLSISDCEKNGHVTQVCIRVKHPPFNPITAVKEFSKTLRDYRLSSVTGDRYSAQWVVSAFQEEGIFYQTSEINKSQIYLEFLPLVMQDRITLLDNPEQTIQFRNLERRTGRNQDSVDHPVGLHDDISNSCAGACMLAGKVEQALPLPSFGINEPVPLAENDEERLAKESEEWLRDKPEEIDPDSFEARLGQPIDDAGEIIPLDELDDSELTDTQFMMKIKKKMANDKRYFQKTRR